MLMRALGPIGLPAIVALIAPENRASMRVAEKIGMTQVGTVPHREVVLTVYRAQHRVLPERRSIPGKDQPS